MVYIVQNHNQKSKFCEVETKGMFILTSLGAPKTFAKFGCQTRSFCNRKEEKTVSQAWVRQTITAKKMMLSIARTLP